MKSTTVDIEGRIIYVTEQTGWLVENYNIDTSDIVISDALIKLGWTPPIEDKNIDVPESGWYD